MNIRWLSRFPAFALSRFGLLSIIPVALITLLSAFLVPRLKVNDTVGFALPPEDPYQQTAARMGLYFPSTDFVIIAVESPDLYGPETVLAVHRVSQKIKQHPGISSVISLSTATYIEVEDEELLFRPLYESEHGQGSLADLRAKITETPLLSRFLLSKDGSAFNIYAFPKASTDEKALIADLYRFLREEKEVHAHIYGTPVMRAEMATRTPRELAVLGAAALALVFIVEVLITRSLVQALLLWLTAMLPAGWVLGFFSLFGIELEVANFFVPIVVLGLATSYGIHLFRYHRLDPLQSMEHTLGRVSPIIISAAFTTVVGFCSLLTSQVVLLRTLGAMLILGIALAAGAALFFLPPLLAASSRIKPVRADTTKRNRIPPSLIRFRTPFILAAVLALLAAGIPRIRHDYRLGIFNPNSEVGKTIDYFQERNGGIDELELVVDMQEEYALIDLDLFRALKEVCAALQSSPDVSQVIGYTDFVEWANAGLHGQSEPLEPRSNAVIGETLELISSRSVGLGIDRLVDPSYSRTRILIRFGISALTAGESERRLNRIRSTVRSLMHEKLPGVEYHLVGQALKNERMLLYLVRGLLSGLALFVPLLLLFLLLVFRSLLWAVITMVPTVSAIILYLGIMGWFHIPFNYSTAFSTAIVLGVSVDDVLYFVLFYRQQARLLGREKAMELTRRKAGVATVQTTVIIDVGLSVLLLSVYTAITHSAILAASGLSFATAVTLLVVPSLLRNLKLRVRKGAS